ncbi:MAG: hypothetical protein RL681_289 [Candidatus Parcubacteria bacterium]|jgi:hypothetical protein
MTTIPSAFTRVMDTLWLAFSGLRVFFIIVDIFVFGVLVYAFVKSFEVRPKFHRSPFRKKRVITLRQAVFREKWKTILRKFHGGSPEAMRITIIEADALADEALKQMNLKGDTMADRLGRLNPDEIPSLNRIWRAHRLRNDIVHRAGFSFAPEEAQSALNDIEAFLKDIGAL